MHCASIDDAGLVADFLSDRESGKRPSSREKKIDALRDGMSVFGSLDAARERWRDLKELADARGQEVRAGDYIAEVLLRPGKGFLLENLEEIDEHMTIWGESQALVQAVARIYPSSLERE